MNKADLNKLEKTDLVNLVLKGESDKADLEAVITDMGDTIEELNQAKKDQSQGKVIVEHKKHRYLVITPSFKLEGVKYGVKDLRSDAKLVEKVLKIEGQNILKLEA